ncbi:hypothetical protein J2Y66_000817 [Paenarthrobacter nitroguajacolicus]|uniref:hypothetical protein n=1 Tax=Paenarthrobacter nitroguajacolicus TaxID=211146 RepID=UPI00285CE9A6|nr:hypothetical protein [Paenarthrobacter nitroguajacolicus]MDR6986347.1 hypothetical protein [Paenarthrobacter nitroguajacolicus]
MGNSGKLAVVAAFVSLGLLVLAAVVLEELVLYLFLGAVLVCYLASLVQVFNRRRYLVVLLAAAGTSLFIGCSIAFLRMWGIAFNQDANALGTAVGTKDSDIYFYLAAVAGVGTLGVLFLGAVIPSFGSRAAVPAKRPATAKRTPPPRKPAPRPGTSAKRPVQSAPRTSGATKTPAVKRPAPRTPTTPVKRPASSASAQRKPAPKR